MPRQDSGWAWAETEQAIIAALDLRAEYQALGVDVNGAEPNAKGWLSCHAVGREDRTPSAAINLATGRYRDLGGDGDSCSLWEFAARFGPYKRWQDARAAFAAKAGVSLPRGRPAADPAEHLEFRPWNPSLVGLWSLKKPGITPEAVQAAGGRLATYRERFTVVALPIYGPGLADADPVGWSLYNTTGEPLPIFRKGGPPDWKKIKQTYGSGPGLIGLHALLRSADGDPAERTVWCVEGPSDLLALWSAIPLELRGEHLVLTNGNGAAERPQGGMLPPFVGRRVRVIRDADAAGEASAKTWCDWLAGSAAEVRHVRLPYPVTESHGKDLRDWLCEGHAFAELLELADQAEVVKASGDGGGRAPIEADDDPHRLARLHLDRCEQDAAAGMRLRSWRQIWVRWTGRAYRQLDADAVKAWMTETVKREFDRLNLAEQAAGQDGDPPVARKVTRGLTNNVLDALASITRVGDDVTEMPAWLDGNPDGHTPHCVAVQNGLLDLGWLLAGRPDYLTPHAPRWLSTVYLDYPFDPDADCPTWKRVLHANLENDEQRINLAQEWAGYLLIPDTSEQKFFIMEGEGANGKSVYCAGIEAMLGKENVSHIPLELFGQRFVLTETLGKLANIAADCGELDKVAEGHLKSFTSGDRMFFDRKGLPGISARPTARMMMATNNRPRFSDKSSGIWRRLLLMPWRIEIPEKDRIKGMDKPEWWEASGELPGLFNWAIAGLHRLRSQGGFTKPELCITSLEDYRRETNPARSFLVDGYRADPRADITCSGLYGKYAKWCSENGYHPLGERQFGKEVKRAFPLSERKRAGTRAERFWIYAGISENDAF